MLLIKTRKTCNLQISFQNALPICESLTDNPYHQLKWNARYSYLKGCAGDNSKQWACRLTVTVKKILENFERKYPPFSITKWSAYWKSINGIGKVHLAWKTAAQGTCKNYQHCKQPISTETKEKQKFHWHYIFSTRPPSQVIKHCMR